VDLNKLFDSATAFWRRIINVRPPALIQPLSPA